jgi:hypothetical protein
MAHFAELNSANEVLRVTVVENKDTADINGVEKEYIGQAHLEKVLGGTWKQTSYNGNMRGNYAGKGYTYFVDQDLFMPPKPYNSWSMATAEATWVAPITQPTLTEEEASAGKYYSWDEDAYQADNTQGWVLNTLE